MKMTKTLILAGMAVATLAVAAQDGSLLRRTFVPGATDVYRIESSMRQSFTLPGMGEQDLTVDNVQLYSVKVNKVDGDTAEIETVTKTEKLEFGGGMASMIPTPPTPGPVTLPGRLDNRNRATFTKIPSSPEMAMFSAALSGTYSIMVELPEKAVRVGDTWQIVVPKGPFTGREDQFLTARLTGERVVDGVSAWVVQITGRLNSTIDMNELAKDNPDANPMGMSMVIKSVMDVKGEGLVEKATARTLQMDTSIGTKQNVNITDMGMSIDSSGTTTMRVRLQK
jgi:hypothetical protein